MFFYYTGLFIVGNYTFTLQRKAFCLVLPNQRIPFQFLIPFIVFRKRVDSFHLQGNVVATRTTCERRLFLTGAAKTLSFRLMEHFSFLSTIEIQILLVFRYLNRENGSTAYLSSNRLFFPRRVITRI